MLFGGTLEVVKAVIQLILRIIPPLSLPLLFLFPSLFHSPRPYIQDALAALETPRGPGQKERKLSTPLSEVIVRNLKVALANSSRDAVALSASPQLKDVQSEKVELDRLLKGSFRLNFSSSNG